jgi:hypothetical protein
MVDIKTLKQSIYEFQPIDTIQQGLKKVQDKVKGTLENWNLMGKKELQYPTWKMRVIHPLSPKRNQEEIWGIATYEFDYFKSLCFFGMFDKDSEFYGINWPQLSKQDFTTGMKREQITTTTIGKLAEYPTWKMRVMHPLSPKRKQEEIWGIATYEFDRFKSLCFFGMYNLDPKFYGIDWSKL